MTGLLPFLLAASFLQKAPEAPPQPVIQGRVRDSRGAAVPDALVAVFKEARTLSQDPPLTTRTDAEGRFKVDLKGVGPHTVRIEAQGLAGQTHKKVSPGTSLTVTLLKGLAIEGVVRDGQTRTPLIGARVEAREEGTRTASAEPALGRLETVTDDKGHYLLSGLSAGLHSITASARGLGSATKTGARPGGARVDLFLFSGASIVGTVYGPGDRPLKGVLVRAEPSSAAPFSLPASSTRATDEHGRFELLGLKGGTYSVFTRARGFAPGLTTEVSVPNEGETDVQLHLTRGGRVQGRLVDAEERPVRGRVAVSEMNGARPSMLLEDVLRTEARDDGRFSLENVPTGSLVLSVAAPGYSPERAEVEVSEKTLLGDVGDIELKTGLTIRGAVSDASGAPVGGASLTGFQMPAPGPVGMQIEALSEADGSFSFGGLEPGSYRLLVSASGYGRTEVPRVEAGTARLAITLKPGGSVRGRVVDDSGKPVPSFRASLRPEERRGMSGSAFESVVSADGSFTLEDLAEGTYVLQIQAPDKVAAVISDVRVSAGAVNDVGRVTVKSGGLVRGFVVDPTGAPVSGAAIQVVGSGVDFAMPRRDSAYSDGQGAFEIQGVPDGALTLVATHPSYAAGRTSGLTVDSRQGPTEARIVLTVGGRVEGYIRTRDPSGLAGATVMVSPRMGGGFFDERSRATPGSDGYFFLEGLPAGPALIMLMRTVGGNMMMTSMSTAQRDVVIREGETTQVEFDLRQILVQGHVTKNGAPAAGYAVSFQSSQVMSMMSVSSTTSPSAALSVSGPRLLKGTTREDGSFELLVEGPGSYSVTVGTQDGKTGLPTRHVEIPDAESHAVELSFTGARVSGVVREKDSETPIPGARIMASVDAQNPAERSLAGATSGQDGRFEMEVDPGKYRFNAWVEGYVGDSVSLQVGQSGATGVRILLSPGLTIKGRVVDRSGRGASGVSVNARTVDKGSPGGGGGGRTLPDGSFVIEGLKPQPHNLFASSMEGGGFAFRAGVEPAKEGVELRLAPGGRVLLRVRTAGGAPVEGARVRSVSLGGVPVMAPFSLSATGAEGEVELALPAGSVELVVAKDQLSGRVTVQVSAETTVAAEVTLTTGS